MGKNQSRNAKWRKKYYEIFEKNKVRKDEVTFENILCNIYVFTNTTEASFASKMLATLNPDKPIWDSRVFDEMLPEYTWISDTKKIDYIIWGTDL